MINSIKQKVITYRFALKKIEFTTELGLIIKIFHFHLNLKVKLPIAGKSRTADLLVYAKKLEQDNK